MVSVCPCPRRKVEKSSRVSRGKGELVLTVIHPSCSGVLEGLEAGVGRWRGVFKAVASSDAA